MYFNAELYYWTSSQYHLPLQDKISLSPERRDWRLEVDEAETFAFRDQHRCKYGSTMEEVDWEMRQRQAISNNVLCWIVRVTLTSLISQVVTKLHIRGFVQIENPVLLNLKSSVVLQGPEDPHCLIIFPRYKLRSEDFGWWIGSAYSYFVYLIFPV